MLLQALTLNGVHYGVELMLEPYASWYRKQDLLPMYRYYRIAAPDARLAAARRALAAEGPRAHVGDRRADRDLPRRLGRLEPPRSAALHRLDLQHDLRHQQRRARRLEAGAGSGGVRLLRDLARARARGAGPQRSGSFRRRHPRRLRGGFARRGAPHLRPLRAAPLDARPRRRCARTSRENPQGKHGRHAYALEEWGLSAGAVRERFKSYIERFDLGGAAG